MHCCAPHAPERRCVAQRRRPQLDGRQSKRPWPLQPRRDVDAGAARRAAASACCRGKELTKGALLNRQIKHRRALTAAVSSSRAGSLPRRGCADQTPRHMCLLHISEQVRLSNYSKSLEEARKVLQWQVRFLCSKGDKLKGVTFCVSANDREAIVRAPCDHSTGQQHVARAHDSVSSSAHRR